MKRILVFLIIAIVIFCAGGVVALNARTLGSLMFLYGGVAVAAVVVSRLIKGSVGRLTGISRPWVCMLLAVIALYPTMLCATLCVNYFGADKSSIHQQPAVVEKVYYKIRHRTKRVGRRTITTGETYKVWYVDLKINSLCTKQFGVTQTQWRRYHAGDTLSIDVERGALGLPVITRWQP